ncbi:MAG: SDR family NAD(P)-dependent oxidoreductase, partial [Acidobacteriota bacterium]|nr:SDR family NAD(P)-dependent oxidoreductase [Acidobacteriota bacterium]
MTVPQKVAVAATGIGAGLLGLKLFRRSKEPELAGEVAIITGGSRGLGLLLAHEFAREGCRIAICARDEEELSRARQELEKRGAEVLAVRCDVTDREDVQHLIDATVRRFGQVDILVNNAGLIQVGPVQSKTIDDFDAAMKVMFWGTVYPTLTLLPEFVSRKKGRIVNITSIGGKVSVPHLLPYTCAKFAAAGFSEGLRAELAPEGITVTTIAPGLMRTGSYLNALFKGDREAESKWFSLGASLPGISISAKRAARQIVTAAKRGESERVLSSPAKLLAKFHGLFPGATSDILGLISGAILPDDNAKNRARKGSKMAGLRSPAMSALLLLGRLAARKFNQTHVT